MEAPVSPEIGNISMGRRWAADPSTSLSSELSCIRHKNYYRGFDRLASAQSQMCNTAGVRGFFL